MQGLRRVKYKRYYRYNQVIQQVILHSVFLGEEEIVEIQGETSEQQLSYLKSQLDQEVLNKRRDMLDLNFLLRYDEEIET